MERSEILTEDWLVQCWKERDNRTFDSLDTNFIRTYRAKPLHNLNLFFFGATDDTEQRHLHTLTLDNGKSKHTHIQRHSEQGERKAYVLEFSKTGGGSQLL